MNKIKILVLTSSFPRSKKDWWAQFIFHIYENISKNTEVILLGPDAPGALKNETFGSVTVHRFSYWYPRRFQLLTTGSGILHSSKTNLFARMQIPLFIFSAAIHSFFFVLHDRPQIFHAHWLIPQGLIGVFIKKLFGVPLVVTVHGSDVFGLKPLKWLKRFVLKNCDVCTVNSSYTRNAVLEIYPETPVSIIPMGVDTKQFSPRKKGLHMRKKLNNRGGPILLCIGRLIGVKGFEYAIRSLPYITKEFPETKLVIVGDGPKRDELINLACELNVDTHTKFIHSIPHTELSRIYASSDICLVPSITDPETGETESQGIVVLEAMASGVPVVASKNGGIPDAIIHNKNGILVLSGNEHEISKQVIEILSDSQLSKRLRAEALLTIREKYDWKKVSGKFEEIYINLAVTY
ncbi:MAG: glycosyltransferase [Candidatus Roizmanbacteria bacterium]|nr:glycosyltransferase [Candidatus Roizmanbacteria bacterium]